ncbi:tail fiber domain-containing protein [Escherichia coli]
MLKGCSWTRKDTGQWGIGFIAQDVKKIFPRQ